MTPPSPSGTPSQPPRRAAAPRGGRTASRQPHVTYLAIALCLAVFLGLAAARVPDTWEALKKWGAPSPIDVWDGAYWGLLTSVFMHRALWHLAFNVYWLWVLGSWLEVTLGSVRYAVFFLSAAVVSSAAQLAVSGDTGIGASGVGYAIFGFVWIASRRYPQFREVLTPQMVQLFLYWLVGCMVLTYLNLWQVGNAAHLSGLLFGAATAACFVVKYKPRLILAALGVLIAVSLVPVFWCPWSVTWLDLRAQRAYEAGDFQRTVSYCNQAIRLDPGAGWLYYNRGAAYHRLGEFDKANADLDHAAQLDPTLKPREKQTPRK